MDVDWLARVKDAGLEIGPLPQLVVEKAMRHDGLSVSYPDVYHRELAMSLRDSARRQSSTPP
jgi:hypothetical protein